MAKYEIAQLDVNSYEGYERSESFDSAEKMFARIKNMQANENGWFYGKGSHILRDGFIIASLHDYECITMPETDPVTGRTVTPKPSIKRLMQYVSEIADA